MNKGIKIQVTEDHIKKGTKRHCTLCPIALAMLDNLGLDYVSVDIGFIATSKGENRRYFTPSRAADRFITRFDSNKPVKPFNFIVRGNNV